jgi:hypothetical protein
MAGSARLPWEQAASVSIRSKADLNAVDNAYLYSWNGEAAFLLPRRFSWANLSFAGRVCPSNSSWVCTPRGFRVFAG